MISGVTGHLPQLNLETELPALAGCVVEGGESKDSIGIWVPTGNWQSVEDQCLHYLRGMLAEVKKGWQPLNYPEVPKQFKWGDFELRHWFDSKELAFQRSRIDTWNTEEWLWFRWPEGQLRSLHHWTQHRNDLQEAFDTFFNSFIGELTKHFPKYVEGEFTMGGGPLWSLLPDVRSIVQDVVHTFTSWPYRNCGIFTALGSALEDNRWKYTSRMGGTYQHPIPPMRATNLTDKELVDTYLSGTPFWMFLNAPVWVPIPLKTRLTHTHIIGRTGSGKTVLMERMIHEDLQDPKKPSLVVITPHSDLIRRLQSLAAPLSDRMILIDPTDAKYPPAINPFAMKRKLSANTIIKTFDYILSALGLELTPKQRSLWKPTIRMLLKLPTIRGRNATIADIRDFMMRPETYKDVIDSLEDPSFFYDNVFVERPGKSEFDGTRKEIGYRLGDILDDDLMRNVLTVQDTKVDFYDELQNRKSVILIDTAKHELADGSPLFGGMMLSLTFQAMFARDAIADEHRRHPTFVYVDEAASFFAEDLSDMLTELRKFRCGLVLAHHDLSQAQKKSTQLAEALVSQPSVRFANASAKDAPELAREMHTEPDTVRLPDRHFAMFVRGITHHPIPMSVTPLRLATRNKGAQEVFKWKNRERVSFGPPPKPQPIEQAPDDDGEWV